MVKPETNNGIIDGKVFGVMFIFNLVGGLFMALQQYIPYYLFTELGLSPSDYAIFSIFFSGFFYFVNPILFLIVLYSTCGGKLFDKIASVLISLILGSLLGHWIGGLLGVPLFASRYTADWSGAVINSLYGLVSVPFGQMLLGFAVLAFFDINKRWNEALYAEKSSIERPFGVVVLSVLYIIAGIVNVCLIPTFSLYEILLALFTRQIWVFIIILAFVVFNGVCQIIIAVGLYSGRKWGWIPAFISTAIGLLITSTTLLTMMLSGAFVLNVLFWAVFLSLFVGSVISAIITFYLLSFNVRRYFGVINPPASREKINQTS